MKPRALQVIDNHFVFEDKSRIPFDNIIWATGFQSNYSWVSIPEAFNDDGKPIHKRGVSAVNGLYFLGLPWQNRRGSALIGGVGEDAKYLLNYFS
ncbi:putative flavoprotein involved in K+ transport [Paenibacillus algorifonticola]|uniref:Putative flavoprotein involved in K+ transport n=1 Tax=Paenibacillus algorifonticola TaxID=684063 RepID=A0A1I1YZP6_9BACL|nr:hypothetical protein [Paenibacillus algorifonticola]SFE23510.1 putative flavoprotein involved in K+ transport [Paenibacillus algorifonticola]